MMELKLPFGFKEGKLVEISQVERGLACGCNCPCCGTPLIARKGGKTIHHFAHDKSAECKGAYETMLHIAAKEILEKHKKIRLPAVISSIGIGWDVHSLYEIHRERYIHFDKVYLEKKLDDIVPDIILEVEGRKLLVEIAVTHFIDEVKLKKIQKLNISTLEIDLSYLKGGPPITIQEIERALLNGLDCKKWKYNIKTEAFRKNVLQNATELKVNSHVFESRVQDCPKRKGTNGESYAIITNDCFNCKYFLDYTSSEFVQFETIKCGGAFKEQIDKFTSRYRKF
ncbi:MAG TPA: competence protein CoiA family protein [Bacteroidia bacterium]|jgi:hypothetical protein|nr:competence protein CoiA family protein [Bacteroidia bacterium]